MAVKRETTMSVGEGPSSGGVNPIPETRVLDWILSGSDEGPSSGKEERAGEGAAKWARRLPHVSEHKCLAMTKRGQGSGKGVEDLISDSGNTSRDVVINDVTLTSLKTPEWSQLVFCDDFVTILFWSLWWRHICSSVTKLVFPS
jgi:hypothetical protein